MDTARKRWWWVYSGLTAVSGVTATVAAVVTHPYVLASGRLWLLVAAMLVLEVVAARMARQRGYTTLTSATVFGMAALLVEGVAAGMLVFAIGGLVTSVLRRRDTAKVVFNLGQMPLSALAAAPLLAAARGVDMLGPPGRELVSDPVAIVVAVAGWFVVNLAFLTSALLLIGEVRAQGVAREMLRRHAPFIVAMLSLAPLVGVVVVHALALFPLLVLPTLSVLRLVQRFLEHEQEAQHDPLTGLTNRRVFTAACETAVAGAQQSGSAAAVLMIDLDDFKGLNDTHGHLAGDEVLRTVGHRLRDAVRSGDTVARLGGDEFGVVLHSVRSADDARRVAAEVEEVLGVPMRVGAEMWTVSASVGWAISSGGGLSAQDLVAAADEAMYANKRGGRRALMAPTGGTTTAMQGRRRRS